MRDLAWLKEEIEKDMIHKHMEGDIYYVSREHILGLINQVEQPEVLSQEWIDYFSTNPENIKEFADDEDRFVPVTELSKLVAEQPALSKTKEIKINPAELFNSRNDVRKYMRIDIRDEDYEYLSDEYGFMTVDEILEKTTLYYKADKVPKEMELELLDYKPVLPVIPEFVAKEIELMHKANYSLRKAFDSLHGADFSRYMRDNEKDFATAYLFGYTVEEKRYYVLDTQGRTLLGKNMVGTVIEGDRFDVDELRGSEIKEHQLTEQEIKEFDERYLVFAREVDEYESLPRY